MNKFSIIIGIFVLAVVICGCEKEFGVKSVTPPIGVLAGGEQIEIIGSGFKAGMGITIYFGNVKADNVVIRGSEKLAVTTPGTEEEGKVDIRILTDDNQELLIKDSFTYVQKTNMDIRDLGKRKSLRDKK